LGLESLQLLEHNFAIHQTRCSLLLPLAADCARRQASLPTCSRLIRGDWPRLWRTSMTHGYVYILINHSMPGLLKIGRTVRDSRARARELSTTSSYTLHRCLRGILSRLRSSGKGSTHTARRFPRCTEPRVLPLPARQSHQASSSTIRSAIRRGCQVFCGRHPRPPCGEVRHRPGSRHCSCPNRPDEGPRMAGGDSGRGGRWIPQRSAYQTY